MGPPQFLNSFNSYITQYLTIQALREESGTLDQTRFVSNAMMQYHVALCDKAKK